MKSTPKNKCSHPPKELFYYNSINEDGWTCTTCKQQLGYRPDFDRDLIEKKVMGLLMDLHEGKFISVSNGSHGEDIVTYVSRRCKKLRRYDQISILKLICETQKSHMAFWKEEARRKLK